MPYLTKLLWQGDDILHRPDGYLFRKRIGMFSRIDDPQMGEVHTLKGLVHRFGYSGGFAEFAFNSIPPAVMDETYP